MSETGLTQARRLVALCCAGWLAAANATDPAEYDADEVQRVEHGALVLENIPPIPEDIAATLFQYQQARAASFAGWLPAPQGILITTRFGQTRQVHHVRDPGGDRQQLTFFPEPINNVVPNSDPEAPGFLFGKDQGGDEHYQIYYHDLLTGRQKRLTHGRARNTAPRWSNLGEYFAYSTTQRNGRDTDIHIYDMSSGESRPVLKRSGTWYTLDWSPDDSRLLVLQYVSAAESYPYLLDLETGELEPFRSSIDPVSFGLARFSRDGRGVYFTSDEDSEFRQLRYHDLSNGDSRLLSGDIPWDVRGFALSQDGRYLVFVVNADGRSQLHLRAIRGWRAVNVPELPMGVVSGLRFSDDGWRIGFRLNSPRSPGDVHSFRVGETVLTQWTNSEVGGLLTEQFVTPELIRYPTFDYEDGTPVLPESGPDPINDAAPDEAEESAGSQDEGAKQAVRQPVNGERVPALRRMIPAFIYRPRDEGPHPVLILMHGGPASQARPTFNPVLQYWANELGLAVIAPNVRGSTGYGRSFQRLDNGLLREDSVRDVGALLDWIAEQPDLDAERVGIIGGSYGGYMVMASLIHFGERLRAGVNVVGISNFVTFLENTRDYRRHLRREEYGDERDPDMRAFLESISPTTHAHRIERPLFVAQGANDPRVPQSESDQMVQTIREHNGEVWYFLALDEGHGFRKKSNRDFYNNAVVLFLRKHLLSDLPVIEEPVAEDVERPVEVIHDVPLPAHDMPEDGEPAHDGAPPFDDQLPPLSPPGVDDPEEPLDPVPEPAENLGRQPEVPGSPLASVPAANACLQRVRL
jgi:dipeptidyl aminopeptidase/acylaminoacyl peptidase